MTNKTTRYAILTYCAETQGWYLSRALPPTSERTYRRDQERILADNTYETDDISAECGMAHPPSGSPSRSVERAARRALKLQRKAVEFRCRAEPGNPFGVEGWDVIWTA
jgi:hypothetical protein